MKIKYQRRGENMSENGSPKSECLRKSSKRSNMRRLRWRRLKRNGRSNYWIGLVRKKGKEVTRRAY
jgi:hypothetical protein